MTTISPDIQKDKEVNEVALLNTLIYLKDDAEPNNGDTVKQILENLKEIYGPKGSYERYLELHPEGSKDEFKANVRQFEKLEQASNNNSNFSSLVVNNQSILMGYNPIGLNAATFTDRNGKVTVVYRGTGPGEWPDNGTGLGGKVLYTLQQRQAQKYFDRIVEENGWDKSRPIIDVSGHSKGGNKAQYVTMTAEHADLIR